MKILDRIAELEYNAQKSASVSFQKNSDARHLAYNEGKAFAFMEAHKQMKAELARLKNKFQNGGLSMDDFPE